MAISRGGLIGTLGAPDGAGLGGVAVRVGGDAGAFTVTTDPAGVFRVPLLDGLPARPARRGDDRDGQRARSRPGSRWTHAGCHAACGNCPPAADRLDLGGEWGFAGGPFHGKEVPSGLRSTRVPGHIIYDGLVPEDGVATFHRTFEVPEAWAGRAVFLRCDGAYGRAEIRVNGVLGRRPRERCDVLRRGPHAVPPAGMNELAITLTEYTPYAVLDDMSWYAHMSLLGIWRDVFLFATPMLHLGQLDVDADWDPELATGSLASAWT